VAEVQRPGREAADGPGRGQTEGQRVEGRVALLGGERRPEQSRPDDKRDGNHDPAPPELGIRLPVVPIHLVDQHRAITLVR
jgi:hypothetical protein